MAPHRVGEEGASAADGPRARGARKQIKGYRADPRRKAGPPRQKWAKARRSGHEKKGARDSNTDKVPQRAMQADRAARVE